MYDSPFHCAGMVEFAGDKLKRCVNGSEISEPQKHQEPEKEDYQNQALLV